MSETTITETGAKPSAGSVRVEQQVLFQGPIPHPQTLSEYNRILPGAADRIIAMAEKQQAHRHDLERTQIKIELRGQIFGFIVGIVGFVGGVVLLALGKNISGMTTFLVPLATLVGLYIYGKERGRRERLAQTPPPTDQRLN